MKTNRTSEHARTISITPQSIQDKYSYIILGVVVAKTHFCSNI